MSVIQVFTRWPIYGQIKTRLAKDIGSLAAFSAYLQLLNHVLTQSALANAEVEVWFAVDNRFGGSPNGLLNCEDCLRQWQSLIDDINVDEAAKKSHQNILHIFLNKNCQFYRQAEGDLGEKLTQAFKSAWSRHEKVLIIGGDSVSVDRLQFQEAFESFNSHELVLIPAEDGGIVLIGASKNAELNLTCIEWGTNQVFRQLSNNHKQLKYHCLSIGWDVDLLNDWQRFLNIYHK